MIGKCACINKEFFFNKIIADAVYVLVTDLDKFIEHRKIHDIKLEICPYDKNAQPDDM
jgi:hypothetical protein